MPSVSRGVVVATAAALLAAFALLALGYWQRGDHIHHLNDRLAKARAGVTAARLAAGAAQSDARHAQSASLRNAKASQTNRKHYLSARERLLNPGHGHVPRHAEGSLAGSVDRFAPGRTHITALELIPPSASSPAQVAVEWTAPAGEYGLPDSGFLLWQAGAVVASGPDLYQTSFRWHVIYDWHFAGAPMVEFVGPPGAEKSSRSDLVATLTSFSVGDLTGDGSPDELVGTDPQGSGGCIEWRVISATGGTATSIFNRFTCDTDISISSGQLLIDAATHRPGCNIHGCGDRRHTLVRWTGSGWAETSSTLVGTPFPGSA